MAAENGDALDWRHLRSAMADMKDLLRCWTCNKIFTDPVKYRCGHYFCCSCADASGTKCGSCNVPSQVSEIQPDCVVSNVVGYFQTLCTLVNFEKGIISDSSTTDNSKKSSRSTLYEGDSPFNQPPSKSNKDHTSKKSQHASVKSTKDYVESKPSKNKNNLKQPLRKRNHSDVSEASLDPESNQDNFVRPSRKRKTSVKETHKVSATSSKTNLIPCTDKEKSSSPTGDVCFDETSIVSKRKSSKLLCKDLLLSEDSDSKIAVQGPQNCFVTPRQPRRSKNPPSFASTSSTKRADSSMIKSTPRKIITPSKELVKRNHKGETPLQVACIKGNVERVRSLLGANASPNTQDHAGWTPLHEAAAQGFCEIVKLLLDAGALVTVPGGNNVTPLHEAVSSNQLPIVKLLVSHGADIYARSSEGKTPMDLVASDEMMEALLNTRKVAESPEALSSTLTANITHIEMVLCGESGLTSEEKSELGIVAAKLGAKLAPVFSTEVTHLIAASDDKVVTCPPSMDVLRAILQGTYILTREWLKLQKDGVCNLEPELFELSGVSDFSDAEAPKLSRENSVKQLPKLFNGCHFYVTNNACYRMPQCYFTRANLISLIKTGGGIVLSRQPDPEAIPASEQIVPYHAPSDGRLSSTSHFIIYAPGKGEPELKYNMKHCKTLPVEWLIHCILNWRLMDP